MNVTFKVRDDLTGVIYKSSGNKTGTEVLLTFSLQLLLYTSGFRLGRRTPVNDLSQEP